MTDKKNAFDLLRLLLAAIVLISHSLLIGGYHLTDPLAVLSKNQTDLAEFGVMGFFSLSGFLITASFERIPNMLVFASHRLLRILPAFWVCLFITGFVIAPLIFYFEGHTFSGFDFSVNQGATGYVVHNFFLKINQWNISGLLTKAAYQGSLNGSLWSLYPEMLCYILTVLAGVAGLFNKNRALYLIVAIAILTFFAINFNFSKSFGPTLLILSPALKLYAAYAAGSLVYVFRDKLLFDKRGLIFLFFFTLMLIKFGGFNLLSPLLIALLLINGFGLFEFKIKYDISYGIYIYSFPVQQLLFQIFGNRLNVIVFILLTVSITAVMGFLSYILIERPFINIRKKTDFLSGKKNAL